MYINRLNELGSEVTCYSISREAIHVNCLSEIIAENNVAACLLVTNWYVMIYNALECGLAIMV